jgi:hypothetical protein
MGPASAHSAQRTRSPRLMRGLWIRHSHRGWRDLRTTDNQEPGPSPAGPIDGNAVAGVTNASATIGSIASDSGLSPAAIPPQPSGCEKRRPIPLLQRASPLVTIVARRLWVYTRLNRAPRHRRLVTPLANATAPRPDTEDGPADQKVDGASSIPKAVCRTCR